MHNEGSLFFFKTNHNAPFSKLIAIDIDSPENTEDWKEVIPESHNRQVLKDCVYVNGKLVGLYLENASDKL